MKIIQINATKIGARPPIQAWEDGHALPDGYAAVPEDMDLSAFYQHNGFVNLTVDNGKVIEISPNVEAWEAWKKTVPPKPTPQPTTKEQLEKIAATQAEIQETIDVLTLNALLSSKEMTDNV